MSVYLRLFRDCAKNNLKTWECPQVLFLITGILTIGLMVATYFIANIYASPEVLVISVTIVALVMLIVGDLVSQTVNKINLAKMQAETERKKTEGIVANLTDGLIMLSPECKVLFINPAACRFLDIRDGAGTSLQYIQDEKLLKKHPKLVKIFSWCPKLEIFKKNRVIVEAISFGSPKKYFKVYTTPVINGANNLLGYIKIFHDVTRDKELDQMKSEFISLASHQLRGPLSGVKWLTELLLAEKSGKLNEEQKKYLQEIARGNERMVRLVSELLDVARIEEHRMELNLQNAQVDKLLFDITEAVQTQASQKNINLKYFGPKAPIYAKIDIDKIKMVFQNLIENAIKYTKPGGRVEARIKEISRDGLKQILPKNSKTYNLKPTTYTMVSVHDNGIGISEEDKKKIFSKFYRGARAKAVEAQGTGLGLYICKQIIEKHNGFIWFSDGEGRGTTFYTAIPKIS